MTRIQYEEAKRVQAEIHAELSRADLTDEQRATLQHHAYALAGTLMSIWLPFGLWRRAVMVILVLVGIGGVVMGLYWAMLAWLLIPIFSPRAVGEITYMAGRFAAGRNS